MASILFLLSDSNPVSVSYVLTRCTSRDARHLGLFMFVSTREGVHLFLCICGTGQEEELASVSGPRTHMSVSPDITTFHTKSLTARFLPVSQNGCDAEASP